MTAENISSDLLSLLQCTDCGKSMNVESHMFNIDKTTIFTTTDVRLELSCDHCDNFMACYLEKDDVTPILLFIQSQPEKEKNSETFESSDSDPPVCCDTSDFTSMLVSNSTSHHDDMVPKLKSTFCVIM